MTSATTGPPSSPPMGRTAGDAAGAAVSRCLRQLGWNPDSPATSKKRSSAATAALAQLRRAVGKPPGSVPEVWTLTAVDLPESTPRLEQIETAVHLALSLYAVHQQSHDASMHEPRVSFGRAVGRLARRAVQGSDDQPYETPIYRRFMALGRATSVDSMAVHARGLVTQLRGAGIGLDYVQFARQLVTLQGPNRSDVLRHWARDFHASERPQESAKPAEESESTSINDEEN